MLETLPWSSILTLVVGLRGEGVNPVMALRGLCPGEVGHQGRVGQRDAALWVRHKPVHRAGGESQLHCNFRHVLRAAVASSCCIPSDSKLIAAAQLVQGTLLLLCSARTTPPLPAACSGVSVVAYLCLCVQSCRRESENRPQHYAVAVLCVMRKDTEHKVTKLMLPEGVGVYASLAKPLGRSLKSTHVSVCSVRRRDQLWCDF